MKLAKILNLLGIKLNIYRVGDIILTTNNRNPKYDYGGTWELWGAGRVPIGVDTSQTEFNEVEKTGGEKKHTMTIAEMPNHNHNIVASNGTQTPGISFYPAQSITSPYDLVDSNICRPTGGSAPFNVLQPYITCYMWKKIA